MHFANRNQRRKGGIIFEGIFVDKSVIIGNSDEAMLCRKWHGFSN
jgi:hypothetical protein